MVIQPKAPSSCPDRSSAPQKARGARPRTWATAAKMCSAWELFFWLRRADGAKLAGGRARPSPAQGAENLAPAPPSDKSRLHAALLT